MCSSKDPETKPFIKLKKKIHTIYSASPLPLKILNVSLPGGSHQTQTGPRDLAHLPSLGPSFPRGPSVSTGRICRERCLFPFHMGPGKPSSTFKQWITRKALPHAAGRILGS